MNYALTFVLAFALALTDSLKPASTTSSQATTAQSHPLLVRFQIINMSGKSREAHIGDAVIPLPVAQRVALQVRAGNSVKIMSNTNRSVMQVIVISAIDEGHLLPVI
jgi:hypothetical protein